MIQVEATKDFTRECLLEKITFWGVGLGKVILIIFRKFNSFL